MRVLIQLIILATVFSLWFCDRNVKTTNGQPVVEKVKMRCSAYNWRQKTCDKWVKE